MKKHYKLRDSNMDLWEKLEKEDNLFHERMDSYEALPEEERFEKYREEVRNVEAEVLKITGDPITGSLWNTLNAEDSDFEYCDEVARMVSLPDCRKDDSLVGEFLRVAYQMASR